MINYRAFCGGELLANTWIAYDDETRKCLIIDLCADFSEVKPIIESLELDPIALILTHGHFDHVIGAKSAEAAGIPVYISEKDSYMLKDGRSCLACEFGLDFDPPSNFNVIEEGERDFGGIRVETIATPGHTAGSVCYIIGNALFCGDTLFKDSYGRCDLPTGDFSELVASAAKLFQMKNYVLCPGHGETSSIEEERKRNPISRYAIKR